MELLLDADFLAYTPLMEMLQLKVGRGSKDDLRDF